MKPFVKESLISVCNEHHLSFSNSQEGFFVWVDMQWHPVSSLETLKKLLPKLV